MLVDINLLPQKEKKKTPLIIPVLLILLLLGTGAVYFGLTLQKYSDEVNRLEQQLVSTQKLREILEQNAVKSVDSGAAAQLQSALNWAENYPVSTYELLRHLAALLPERGFLLAFSYEDSGVASLSIQFDSSREAAYYLRNLEESEFVEKASLLSISTEPIMEGNGEETSIGEAPEDVLPRYIAQFTIQTDEAAIKKAVREKEGES